MEKQLEQDLQNQLKGQMQLESLLKESTPVLCPNCGNKTFVQTNLMRHVSAILSPMGEESYIPMPVFECSSCGTILEATIHPFIKTLDEKK